jgi:polysaccharide biosynthesis/export protein
MKYISCFLLPLILLSHSVRSQSSRDILKLVQSGALDKSGSSSVEKLKNIIDNSDTKNETKNVETISGEKTKNLILELEGEQSSVNSANNLLIESSAEELTSETEDIDLVEIPNDQVDILPDLNEATDNLSHFGYNLFETNPDIFQRTDDLTVNGDYVVNPGDEIIIMLWGDTEINRTYFVSRDGYLFIENLGQIFVNGLTLDKLEKKLFNQLRKIYSSLGSSGENATTFFDLSLGSSVRNNKRVFALGEVENPGAYDLKRSTTLFSSLYFFNGPKTTGSLRNVLLFRDDKKVGSIDFYDFLLGGKKTEDLDLLVDDVVFFPIRNNSISIDGEIGRPAIYELREGEGLKDLIKIAGGILNTSYLNRLRIFRIQSHNERHSTGLERVIIDVDLKKLFDSKEDFTLYDGDKITIFKISDFISNQVRILGAVQRPGEYEFENGMILSDLIKKADGLSGDAYLKRSNVIRLNQDGSESFQTVNLESILNGEQKELFLMPNDEIKIFSNSDILYETDLLIEGHVLSPGSKKFRHGTTLLDLIHQGGGFDNEDHLKNAYLEKAYLSSWSSKEFKRKFIYFRLDSVLAGNGIADLELKMGDKVRIFDRSEIKGLINNEVSIVGNVKNPGVYDLYDKMKLKDLLFLAGGFDDDNFSNGIYYSRAHLLRFDEFKKNKKIIMLNLEEIIINGKEDIFLQSGDQISIFSTLNYDSFGKVIVQGSVASPGDYDLAENLTLNDIILEAGNFLPNIETIEIEISRINNKKNKNIKFYNFQIKNNIEVLGLDTKNNSSYKNFMLQDGDFISIRPSISKYDYAFATITGELLMPGNYVINEGGEKITDLIKRAGGVTDAANLDASIFVRNQQQVNISLSKIVRYPNSQQNFLLLNGDEIIIGEKTELISIEGEVNNPGIYKFNRGLRFRGFIKLAGGYTVDAQKSQSYIVYPNGTSKKNRFFSFSSPRIVDGSKIIVVRKEAVEPFSLTDYVTNLTSIYADFTQAYLLIVLAARQ